MNTETFYTDLPVGEQFVDISNPSNYAPLPDDWFIALSDVRGSTELIRLGKYKEVNLVGASTIIALLNLKKSFSLPFIFGGDGASVCIPPSLVEQARESLLATRMMARQAYGIDLRVGMVPHSYVREQGYDVWVARFRISENFVQAAFSGGGLQFAEECLKNPATERQFVLSDEGIEASADFSGLECRWKNVPSAHGEIVTLIVQATGATADKKNKTYREVIRTIGTIYGADVLCRPVREEDLSMSLSERQLSGESRVRSFGRGVLYRFFYWFKIRYGVLLGRLLMGLHYKSAATDWGVYKRDVAANTDFKKFDDKLRQVLSGTPEQREQLVAYLDDKYRSKELAYGVQFASTAIITCLIFSYNDAHIHLVDSDNGGYAVASVQLKERLRAIQA
jgi:hypothetical protein